MTKNVLDERPALLRRLHIPRCLHTLVERLARRTDALGVGRGRPIAVRRDYQLALRIDENALPEDALRGEAAVVVGPPLIAIAAARNVDPRLLRRCRREPVVGQHLLTACDAAVQDKLAETRIILDARRHAAAADLVPQIGKA